MNDNKKTKAQLIAELRALQNENDVLSASATFGEFHSNGKYPADFYSLMPEDLPLAFQSLNLQRKILYVNTSWLNMAGYSKDQVIGKPFEDFVCPSSKEIFYKAFSRFIKEGNISNVELELTHGKNKTVYVVLNGCIIRRKQKTECYTHCFLFDITKRKQMEMVLTENRDRLNTALESTGIGLWDQDMQQNTVIRVGHWADMLGYSDDEISEELQAWKNLVHHEDLPAALYEARKHEEGLIPFFKVEHRMRMKNGSWRWILNWGRVIERDVNNRPLRAIGAHIDIHERKMAEEKLKSLLREKEVLLREVHHRVKNNFQVISSLLQLQSNTLANPAALGPLKESQTRIRTMALLHEKLYNTDNFAILNFKDYITDLAGSLFSAYSSDICGIELLLNVENIFLDIDEAVPCGLVMNELISNAIKHAFPARQKNRPYIKIQMRMNSDNKVIMSVEDNGVGLPATVQRRGTKSLGLRLVYILIEDQLKGKISVSRVKGTRFAIQFISQQKNQFTGASG